MRSKRPGPKVRPMGNNIQGSLFPLVQLQPSIDDEYLA